ncbi:MAG: Fur family transcriptional regulator [Pacificimonas sp.]|jgi:Fur family zinc uptake transcriptional regulator|nr:Fur family transcriptional regulator [Pacificimonas sp.]
MTEHREYHGTALAHAAERTLSDRGEKWTEMRGLVFDTLAAMDGPASAYDIADQVSRRRGKRVAPNSIYRILDLFVDTNVVKRVETANAYVANRHPECLHDCIFLICKACGGVTHIDDDNLSGSMRARAESMGFRPEEPVMEVRGLCADCAA